MKLRYHPEAREELRAAIRVGEDERPGRGVALQQLVHAVERRIQKLPRSAPPWPRLRTSFEVRNAVVRRTPYLLVYAILPDQLVVIALAHTKQEPGYWRRRFADLD
ncbi:MAG: type II toxin-antitoxin system RelE/ParE family toxin [Candidatus Binatia bacterium]